MLDGMKINGRLASKDEKNIYVTTWDGKTLKIPEEGIYKIKIKKFFIFEDIYIYVYSHYWNFIYWPNQINEI